MVYVDDLLIASQNLHELRKLKEALSKNFQMKDLDPMKDILGINIERDVPTGKMRLTQRRYIANLLQKFEMENCKSISTHLNRIKD